MAIPSINTDPTVSAMRTCLSSAHSSNQQLKSGLGRKRIYRKLRSVLVSTLMLVALVAASQVLQVSAKQLKILEFDTVVSLPPAFTAGQNPIRNVNGRGLP